MQEEKIKMTFHYSIYFIYFEPYKKFPFLTLLK